MRKFKCAYCTREFNNTSHHFCDTGFRKKHHKFKPIKQMIEEKTIFEREFASFEAAERLHKEGKQFYAFGYWNQLGDKWKLNQNPLTLGAIKAPLLQQYIKLGIN